MVIDFMLIGLPRSGTTWAANWLTTEDSFCLHDPLYKIHYADWDKSENKIFPYGVGYSKIGVSCTGIWRFPEFVNKHPAKKVVLVRDFNEVQYSMSRMGLPELPKMTDMALMKIRAPRFMYSDLFRSKPARKLWEYLLGDADSFCPIRHARLCEMYLQPCFNKLEMNLEVTIRLRDELNKR